MVFTDDGAEASGSSDDEDTEKEADEENVEADLSEFLQEARANSERDGPPVKRQRVDVMLAELPVFADSEDELEWREDEAGDEDGAENSGHDSEDSEDESEDECEGRDNSSESAAEKEQGESIDLGYCIFTFISALVLNT